MHILVLVRFAPCLHRLCIRCVCKCCLALSPPMTFNPSPPSRDLNFKCMIRHHPSIEITIHFSLSVCCFSAWYQLPKAKHSATRPAIWSWMTMAWVTKLIRHRRHHLPRRCHRVAAFALVVRLLQHVHHPRPSRHHLHLPRLRPQQLLQVNFRSLCHLAARVVAQPAARKQVLAHEVVVSVLVAIEPAKVAGQNRSFSNKLSEPLHLRVTAWRSRDSSQSVKAVMITRTGTMRMAKAMSATSPC